MSTDTLEIDPTRWKTVTLNDVCEGIMGLPHKRDELSDEQHEGFHSTKNPNKAKEAPLREPEEILAEIAELDAESANVLEEIRGLL